MNSDTHSVNIKGTPTTIFLNLTKLLINKRQNFSVTCALYR